MVFPFTMKWADESILKIGTVSGCRTTTNLPRVIPVRKKLQSSGNIDDKC